MNLQLHIYDRRKSHPAALTTQKYSVGKELFKASFSREYLLTKRNSFVYIFKLVKVDLNLVFVKVLIKLLSLSLPFRLNF
jgi:hypothetical protein